MRGKKGFTFIELLAVIVILGVVITIAGVTYSKIRKNTLERQYNNLKALIETKATKYASKTGYITMYVKDLVEAGYLEGDDLEDNGKSSSSIYDPRDNSVLDCHLVTIAEDEYGNLKATLHNESYATDTAGKVCNTNAVDTYSSKLTVTAKVLNGSTVTNINYDPTSSTTQKLNSSDKIPVVINGWTSKPVRITAAVDSSITDRTNSVFMWNKNPDRVTTYPTNYIDTNEYQMFNNFYYVNYTLQNGETYEGRIRYRYDAEAPVIFSDKLTIVEKDKINSWTNEKTVVIYASDGSGVGLSKVYVGTRPCSDLQTDYNSADFVPAVVGNVFLYKLDSVNVPENGTEFNVCAIDKLGNLAETAKFTVKKIDVTAPTCDFNVTNATAGENGWYKSSSVRVNLTRSDNLSGIAKYDISLDNTASYKNTAYLTQTVDTDKNGLKYYGYVKDNAGNTGTCTFTVKKDSKKPECTFKVRNGATIKNGWYNQNLTIGISKTDASPGSGGVDYDLSTTSISSPTYATAYNADSTVTLNTESSSLPVYGYVKDIAGNVNSCTNTYKIDKSGPTVPTMKMIYVEKGTGTWTEYENDSWYSSEEKNGSASIYMIRPEGQNDSTKRAPYGSTDSLSGVDHYEISDDGTDYETYSYNHKITMYVIKENGTHYRYFRACDKAGNCSSAITKTIKIDNEKPTIPHMKFISQAYDGAPWIDLTGTWTDDTTFVSDWNNVATYATRSEGYSDPNKRGPWGSVDNVSGIQKYQISTDNSNWVDFAYNGKNDLYRMITQGTHTRYFRAVDNAGNVSDVLTMKSRVDKTKPTCESATPSYTSCTSSNKATSRTASITCSDSGGSGCVQSTYSKKITSGVVNTYTFTIADKAGNTQNCPVYVCVDNSKEPTCSFTINGTKRNGWYIDNSITVTLDKAATTTTDAATKWQIVEKGSSEACADSPSTYSSSDSVRTKTLSSDTSGKKYCGYTKNASDKVNKCEITVKKDSKKPECTISVPSTISKKTYEGTTWYTADSVLINVSGTDATSGFDGKGDVAINNSANAIPNPPYGTPSYTLNTDTNGTAFMGYIRDKAGNTSTCGPVAIYKDSTGPICRPKMQYLTAGKVYNGQTGVATTVGANYPGGNVNNYTNTTNSQISFVANCSDSGAGIKNYTYTSGDDVINTTVNSNVYNFLSTYVTGFGVIATDNLGHTSSDRAAYAGSNSSTIDSLSLSNYQNGWQSHLVRIDQTAPVASYSYTPTEYKTGNNYYSGVSFIYRCDKSGIPIDNSSGGVVQWGSSAANSEGLTRPNNDYIIKFDTTGKTGSVATSYSCSDVLGNSTVLNASFNIVSKPASVPEPGNIQNNPGSRTCNFVKTSDGRIIRQVNESSCKSAGYDSAKYVDADEEGGKPYYGCKSWSSDKKTFTSKPTIIEPMAPQILLRYSGDYYYSGTLMGDSYLNGYKCTEFLNYGQARTSQSPPGEVYHLGCCNY